MISVTGKTENRNMKEFIINYAPLLGLAAVIIIFSILTGGKSTSPMNLRIIVNTFLMTALAATGAVFTYSCGAIDMSIGGTIALSAIAGALVGQSSGSFTLAILTVILIALVISLVKGFATAYLTLPVFIVTFILGTLLSAIGLVLLGNETIISLRSIIPVKDPTLVIGTMLAVFFLISLILFNFTAVGKKMKLLGGNRAASRQIGIDNKKILITAFLINGAGAALAAIATIIRTKTVTPGTGGSISADLMIAIVLGGMPLSGGSKSRISAAIIGVSTITVLNNGLSILKVSNDDIQIVRGIMFLIVVYLTSITYRTKYLPR